MESFKMTITSIAPFVRYGQEHLLWLVFSIIYTYFWIRLGKKQVSQPAQQAIAYLFSSIAIITWMIMTFAHIYWDFRFQTPTTEYPEGYSRQSVYPLHLCYMLNLLLPLMHVFRSKTIFDLWYPWVIAVCFQALLTADLDEAFPHYYNLRYFIVHATLVLHVLYAAFVYRFKPTYWTPIRALIAGNLYFGLVHLVNLRFHTNFMYTMETPPGTALDLLGSNWVLKADAILIVLFYLVCSPFYLSQRKQQS